MTRHRNDGIRKLCGCHRRKWATCEHSWHFNFKPAHGSAHRFSLDAEVGKRLSKADAQKEAATIRAAILAGTFRRRADVPPPPPPGPAPVVLTLRQFAEKYLARPNQNTEPTSLVNDTSKFKQLCAFTPPIPADGVSFGDRPLDGITADDLEVFMAGRRAKGAAASTRNKYVQLIKASFRWAVKKGYLKQNVSADAEIKREKNAQRHRRLETAVVDSTGKVTRDTEERRLLAVASDFLQRLIIGALETGCRRGELQKLQWADVDLKRRKVHIRAAKAKTRTARGIPISSRLLAVLEMVRTDPAGEEYPPSAYVFGSLGLPVQDFKRSWATTVLKAHGFTPIWNKSKLSAQSRADLRSIDLHFHDLRHEAGSRWVEAGIPLHHVMVMLGHTDLEQTTTYLNVTAEGLDASMRKFDDTRNGCEPLRNTPSVDHPPFSNDAEARARQPLIS